MDKDIIFEGYLSCDLCSLTGPLNDISIYKKCWVRIFDSAIHIYPKVSQKRHYFVIDFEKITLPEVDEEEKSDDLYIKVFVDLEPYVFLAENVEIKVKWLKEFTYLSARCEEAAELRTCKAVQQETTPVKGRNPNNLFLGVEWQLPSWPFGSSSQANGVRVLNNGKRWVSTSRLPLEVIDSLVSSMQIIYSRTSETQKKTPPKSPLPPSDIASLRSDKTLSTENKAINESIAIFLATTTHVPNDNATLLQTSSSSSLPPVIRVDDWLLLAEAEDFMELSLETAELQQVDLSILSKSDMAKFFVAAHSLLCMQAAGVLKCSIADVIENHAYDVGYDIGSCIYTLFDLSQLCQTPPSTFQNI